MTQSQFSLSWESYKSNICSGFSSLQQNGEFVDMTIAADGHFVKVHQVLMALSSPYLKELISSAPCQHPVIFLNNVSHATLCLILEYVYTGEVLVPSRSLTSFIEAAKNLHIKGLENMDSDNADGKPCFGDVSSRGVKRKSNFSEEIALPTAARKIFIKHESDSVARNRKLRSTSNVSNDNEDIPQYSLIDESDIHDSEDHNMGVQTQEEKNSAIKDRSTANLQFTVSIRGSLQVILNRYMYNLHSTQASGIRRWRCIDYRNKKCTAFLVTLGNVVMNRANPHNHTFHDKKILAKIEKNAVYTAIDDVEGYKEKESKGDNETSMDNEFTSIEIELQDLTENNMTKTNENT